MKKLLLLLITVVAFENAFAQGVQFEHGTFEEALSLAKKENKMVFMDCYTSWCAPCKKLSKNVFPQEEIGTFFNANFVNIKMDMESEEGKLLQKKYNIYAYPTLLWLDAEGNIEHKKSGGGDQKLLIETAKLALNVENNWAAMNKQFLNGDHSLEFLEKFIKISSNAHMDIQEAADVYFSIKKNEELINKEDIVLIMKVVKSSSHPIFQFTVKNKEKFYALFEEEGVLSRYTIKKYFENILKSELIMAAKEGGMDSVTNKKNEFFSLDNKIGSKAAVYYDIDFSRNISGEKKDQLFMNLIAYSKKHEFDNSNELRRAILKIYEGNANKDVLEKTLKLCERMIELDSHYIMLDTYAIVLHKLGKKDKAIEQAKKVMELADEDTKPYLQSSLLLNNE